MKDLIDTTFGGKIRVRVCGILIKDDAILLINHKGLVEKEPFWAPPGGGLEFGETIHACLKREFKEECNIDIKVEKFLFLTEFTHPPLHAIELFYKVTHLNGVLKLGTDPELKVNLLKDLRFFDQHQLIKLNNSNIHQAVYKYLNY